MCGCYCLHSANASCTRVGRVGVCNRLRQGKFRGGFDDLMAGVRNAVREGSISAARKHFGRAWCREGSVTGSAEVGVPWQRHGAGRPAHAQPFVVELRLAASEAGTDTWSRRKYLPLACTLLGWDRGSRPMSIAMCGAQRGYILWL